MRFQGREGVLVYFYLSEYFTSREKKNGAKQFNTFHLVIERMEKITYNLGDAVH